MNYPSVVLMKKSRKIAQVFQSISAICMVLALLWLTISLPFVNAYQQEIAKQTHKSVEKNSAANEEESSNPFGNNTEEKAPGGMNSLSEEYLHDHDHDDLFFSSTLEFHKCENIGTYIAFHGELLVPPPNAA